MNTNVHPPPILRPDVSDIFDCVASNGLTYERLTVSDISALVAASRITFSDKVRINGQQNWVTLSTWFSPLTDRDLALAKGYIEVTCPRCQKQQIAKPLKRMTTTGVTLLIVGAFLTPLLVGIPVFIIAFACKHVVYHCSHCGKVF